eukprot:273335_1
METDNELTFDSCEEFEDIMETDDYWCWNAQQDDYSQIFLLLGFVLLLYSAQYLLIYTSFINRMMAINKITIPIQSTESIIPFPEVEYHDKSIHFFSFIIHLLIHFIYVAIKIIILHSTHLSTINQKYQAMDFRHFVNTQNILLVLLLLLAPKSFILDHIIFRRVNIEFESHILWRTVLRPFSYILLCVDVIFSFVLLCIYYSLFILILYWIALELFVYCLSICVFICSIVFFTSCIVECCVNNQCICLIEDDSGDIIIKFPDYITCTHFMLFTFLILLYFGFGFGIIALRFLLMWCFVGGPTHVVLYADFNNSTDYAIYWLFIIAFVLGMSTFIGMTLRLCCNDNRSRQVVIFH